MARTLKVFDGLVFTELAGFEATDHGVQLVEL
jgi:hypothetical protein